MSTSPKRETLSGKEWRELSDFINEACQTLGFETWGVADLSASFDMHSYKRWLEQGYQGDMAWLAEHAELKEHPSQLHPGAKRALCVTMRYSAKVAEDTKKAGGARHFKQSTKSYELQRLKQFDKAYIALYARGRDYHKVMRKALKKLSTKLDSYLQRRPSLLAKLIHVDNIKDPQIESYQARPFVDSAPVLERPMAERAGLGWIGKHSLLLSEERGSYTFIGELFTPLLLPTEPSQHENLCGDCSACLKICPTDAFVEPYVLDARKCLAYLTIEQKGPIPVQYRRAMGNRIFGCDDCQIACPFNRPGLASESCEELNNETFVPRHAFSDPDLLELVGWSEEQFLNMTEGSPIRRTGYACWLRNLAVAIGNIESDARLIEQAIVSLQTTMREHLTHHAKDERFQTAQVAEHVAWALDQLENAAKNDEPPDHRTLGPVKLIHRSSN